MNLFISYSGNDRRIIDPIEAYLRESGFAVWRDIHNIAPGTYWTDEIDKGLRACDVILAFVSNASIRSRNVRNEWDWAHPHRKRLVFVLLEPIDWMPPAYRGWHAVDASQVYQITRQQEKDVLYGEVLTAAPDDGLQTAFFTHLSAVLRHEQQPTYDFAADHLAFQQSAHEQPEKPPPFGWYTLSLLRQGIWAGYDILNPVYRRANSTKRIRIGYRIEPPPAESRDLQPRDALRALVKSQENEGEIPHVALVGEIGSGKTTLLEALLIDLLETSQADPHEPVPVFIDFKEDWALDTDTALPLNVIIDTVTNNTGLNADYLAQRGEPPNFVEMMLREGRFVLLIDGFETLNWGVVYRHIRDVLLAMRKAGWKAPVIFACDERSHRVIDPDGSLPGFHIEPITDAQIIDQVREDARLEGLRAAIAQEPMLKDAARTVYFLKAMLTGHRDLNVGVTAATDNVQKVILDRFVRRQIADFAPNEKPEAVMGWLRHFAHNIDKKVQEAAIGFWTANLPYTSGWITPRGRLFFRLLTTSVLFLIGWALAMLWAILFDTLTGGSTMTVYGAAIVAGGALVGVGLVILEVFTLDTIITSQLNTTRKNGERLQSLRNEADVMAFDADTIRSEMQKLDTVLTGNVMQRTIRMVANAQAEARGTSKGIRGQIMSEGLGVVNLAATSGYAVPINRQGFHDNFLHAAAIRYGVVAVSTLYLLTRDVGILVTIGQVTGIALMGALLSTMIVFIVRKGKLGTLNNSLSAIFLWGLVGFLLGAVIAVANSAPLYGALGAAASILYVQVYKRWRARVTGKDLQNALLETVWKAFNGWLFGVAFIFSSFIGNMVAVRIVARLGKYLVAHRKLPKDFYAFIDTMGEANILTVLKENDGKRYIAFTHPLLAKFLASDPK